MHHASDEEPPAPSGADDGAADRDGRPATGAAASAATARMPASAASARMPASAASAPTGPVEIDGSHGEGGGQILRTSLALAMLTGRPLQMQRIRAGRAKPGLRRQHLACVEAAARLCNGAVHGATVGSQELELVPGPITGGTMHIDIGTGGSTTLVVQTILVPAIAAGVALRAVIRGGTHNPLAPPFEFLDRIYAPELRAMGAALTLTLDHHGFAASTDEPAGDRGRAPRGERGGARAGLGQLTVEVAGGGGQPLRPIERLVVGDVVARRATVILARLPTHVADREHAVVRRRLGLAASECELREVEAAATANVLMVEVAREGGGELVSAHGERGLRAELVAARACDDVEAFLAADVPVGEHLADQLLLPLAVAGGGRFRAAPLSLHARTNIDTILRFLDVKITVERQQGADVVTIG